MADRPDDDETAGRESRKKRAEAREDDAAEPKQAEEPPAGEPTEPAEPEEKSRRPRLYGYDPDHWPDPT